ncbi:hypothetical protein [Flavimaricola marinus]|uniref:Uncharacterized protein n=1 Tax=Flavimaricola marinus TaxID=1819565 RepID=A0A238LE99_9RHOB|nr:hypothetical protein [Flavimaricola marinus]SMY07938.1 hypothetical protein LOM8899_02083 [Flavimaricola marinus]
MLTGLIILVVVIACGFAGMLWLRQREIANHEAMQALAARRGWSLNVSNQSLGRPAVLRLSARSGVHWQAEARRLAPTTPFGGATGQTTDFRGPEPIWPEALLVIGPSGRDALVDQAHQMLDGTSGGSAQKLLGQAASAAVLPMIDQLTAQPAPDGVSILATQDPSRAFDLKDIAKLIREWSAQRANDMSQPIVILGPDGFRMRLGHGTSSAEQMEQFIDLALAIGRVIERP